MSSPLFLDLLPEHLDTLGPEVRRIDVREPDEFEGPLGPLPRAELVPLGTLQAACATWSREAPLLLTCRSGRRSVMAARLLAQHGFGRLYNLKGGLLAVRERAATSHAPGAPST